MFKEVIHQMESGADRYAVISHGKEECKCSPTRSVAYRNVGKSGATVVVTYTHKA